MITQLERGVASDMDGNYEITDIPVGTYTLNVSFVGYQAFKLKWVSPSTKLLHQVLNVGFEVRSTSEGQ